MGGFNSSILAKIGYGILNFNLKMSTFIVTKYINVDSFFQRFSKSWFSSNARNVAPWEKRGHVNNRNKFYKDPKPGPSYKMDRKKDYLYGHNVIIPALTFRKREITRIFVKKDRSIRTKRDREVDEQIRKLSEECNIRIENVHSSILDYLCSQRPHQNIVVEATPLPCSRIDYLTAPDATNSFKAFGGVSRSYDFSCNPKRPFPLILALDYITDPQNLGSIIRSALFFGVDGVVISKNNSAPLNGVASKASSGAIEVMPVYYVAKMKKFLLKCKENGWYVAGTGPSKFAKDFLPESPSPVTSSLKDSVSKGVNEEHGMRPMILCMGSEGNGLRLTVINRADSIVNINSTNEVSTAYLDSLNVGVATGILLHSLYSGPSPLLQWSHRCRAPADEENDDDEEEEED